LLPRTRHATVGLTFQYSYGCPQRPLLTLLPALPLRRLRIACPRLSTDLKTWKLLAITAPLESVSIEASWGKAVKVVGKCLERACGEGVVWYSGMDKEGTKRTGTAEKGVKEAKDVVVDVTKGIR
jgi:hypothetical protein